MASNGRMKREKDPRPIVLALEAQNANRPPARRRASVPKTCSIIPDNITVLAGEDVIERIRTYFQCPNGRPNFRTSYLNGHVLSAHGEVSNPALLRQGSPIVFEGVYAIGTLSGWYKVPRNGPVEQENLRIAFYGSHGQGNGGDVTGSLIAATEVQVMVFWTKPKV